MFKKYIATLLSLLHIAHLILVIEHVYFTFLNGSMLFRTQPVVKILAAFVT